MESTQRQKRKEAKRLRDLDILSCFNNGDNLQEIAGKFKLNESSVRVILKSQNANLHNKWHDKKNSPTYDKVIDLIMNKNMNTVQIRELLKISLQRIHQVRKKAMQDGVSIPALKRGRQEYHTHRRGRTIYVKICKICEKEFSSHDKKKILCSMKCAVKNREKVDWPDNIEEIVRSSSSMSEVGRELGVAYLSVQRHLITKHGWTKEMLAAFDGRTKKRKTSKC
jgi:hypothetical protein